MCKHTLLPLEWQIPFVAFVCSSVNSLSTQIPHTPHCKKEGSVACIELGVIYIYTHNYTYVYIYTYIYLPPLDYTVFVGKYRDRATPFPLVPGLLQDLYDGFKAPTFRARLEKLWQQKLKMDVRPLPRGLEGLGGVVRLLVRDG